MSTPPALESLHDDRSTLAGRALDALPAAIADGRLVAGERYSVAGLAVRFGVSRTPVREALLLLERQGVVRFERNRGVRVLETTAHDLEEVFSLRLLLEVPATRRACEGDEGAFMAHDKRFHEVILRASGNLRLAAFISRLRDVVRHRGASMVGRGRDLGAILAEHVVILEALRARDPAAAAQAMRRHLDETGRLLLAQGHAAAADLRWAPPADD